MTATQPAIRHPTGLFGPIRLRRPSRQEVEAVARASSASPLSYALEGATRLPLPEGWDTDEQWRVLGHGEEAWQRACTALNRWTQFDLGWVVPHDREVPIEPGRTFAFTSKQLGVYTINVCRVVYGFGSPEHSQFGFAYGTLGSHMVRGEERFELLRTHDGRVVMGIRKFSQPAHWLVQLLGPLARRLQRRFSQDALARMHKEVLE